MTPQQRLQKIIDMAGDGNDDSAIATAIGSHRYSVAVTRLTLGIPSGWKVAMARKAEARQQNKSRHPIPIQLDMSGC